MSVMHETIHLSQTVTAPLDATWAAFTDTSTRAMWSVPEGEEQVYDHDDFRPQGRARYRCGAPGKLEFRGEIEYVQVLPAELIVHTDTVWVDDTLLSTALLTWSFTADGNATTVAITDQVISFVGPDMIEGHRNGHRQALAQLDRILRP